MGQTMPRTPLQSDGERSATLCETIRFLSVPLEEWRKIWIPVVSKMIEIRVKQVGYGMDTARGFAAHERCSDFPL